MDVDDETVLDDQDVPVREGVNTSNMLGPRGCIPSVCE